MQLAEAEAPFSIIYTKSDKLSATALEKQISNNNQILLEYWEELPPVFISSAVKGTGKEKILSYIETFI
jgi:GTP-binding protein